MAARSIWKGAIAFGLVQIPVDLHVAEEPDDLSFRQLDKHDFSPIGYERVNKSTGKKVAWEDIVKGYEYDKDEYVVLSEQELEEANVEATHTIDIVAFVDKDEIPPMYFDKPYYLAPTRQGAKAYALLRDVMKKKDQIGLAKVVIRTRQHLAALLPREDALMLLTMRYPHELRKADDLPIPHGTTKEVGLTAREIDMAEQLVEGMHDKFDPTQYHDEYRDDVMALIERKAKAGEINTIPEAGKRATARPAAQIVDLMSMLKKSLGNKNIPKGSVKKARNGHGHHKRKSA